MEADTSGAGHTPGMMNAGSRAGAYSRTIPLARFDQGVIRGGIGEHSSAFSSLWTSAANQTSISDNPWLLLLCPLFPWLACNMLAISLVPNVLPPVVNGAIG